MPALKVELGVDPFMMPLCSLVECQEITDPWLWRGICSMGISGPGPDSNPPCVPHPLSARRLQMMRYLEREGLVPRTDTRLQITLPQPATEVNSGARDPLSRLLLAHIGHFSHLGIAARNISPDLPCPRKQERATSTSPTTRCRHNRPFKSAGTRPWPALDRVPV